MGNFWRWALFASFLGLYGTCEGQPVTIVVHASHPAFRIDRHIYGQFAEHLGRGIYEGVWVGERSPIPNERGFRKDVIAALRELRVPVVRWPGGCFADEYHWRDGIGPREQRPTTINTNWGGVAESNQFGTHEFMDFVELIGADAYINGNVGTGSPREMAEWLQYLTSDQKSTLTAERARNGHPKPWKVAYLAVGNELWGCGGNMSPQHYADQLRQFSAFLKSPPGKKQQIIASGGHDDDVSWSDTLAQRATEDVQAITYHYYTIPTTDWKHKGSALGFPEGEWISTFSHAFAIEGYLSRNIEALNRRDPANKIGLAVDEWGTWYDPEPGREPGFLYQQNTLRDALVAAVHLNLFHAHADRIHMANIAQMVNVLQAMILTDGTKMLLTPTYHVFSMYRPFQDARYLPTDFKSPEYALDGTKVRAISMSAARTQDEELVMAFANLDPRRAFPLEIALDGEAPQLIDGTILGAAAMDAHNTFDTPHALEPKPFSDARWVGGKVMMSLPAKSVVVLRMHQ